MARFTPPLGPGFYHVEVSHCEEGVSAKGDEKLTVKLAALDHRKEGLCQDTIMLGGPGRGMGAGKLKRLGVTIDLSAGGDIHPHDLIGKRCYVYVENEIYNSRNGPVESLKVKGAEGNGLGYWLESEPPPSVVKAKENEVVDPLGDTPF
jgi:hypothetical protein